MTLLSLGDSEFQTDSILDNSGQPVSFPDVCSVGNDRMISPHLPVRDCSGLYAKLLTVAALDVHADIRVSCCNKFCLI